MKIYLLTMYLLLLGAAPTAAQVQSPDEYKQAAIQVGLPVWTGLVSTTIHQPAQETNSQTAIALLDSAGDVQSAYVLYDAKFRMDRQRCTIIQLIDFSQPKNVAAIILVPEGSQAMMFAVDNEHGKKISAEHQYVAKSLTPLLVNGLAYYWNLVNIDLNMFLQFEKTGSFQGQ